MTIVGKDFANCHVVEPMGSAPASGHLTGCASRREKALPRRDIRAADANPSLAHQVIRELLPCFSHPQHALWAVYVRERVFVMRRMSWRIAVTSVLHGWVSASLAETLQPRFVRGCSRSKG